MIDMASVYAERYKQNPQALQAAVMGQSPDPKLDPYTALNALRLVKESNMMAMAGKAQQPTSGPSIVSEAMAPPTPPQGLGAMMPMGAPAARLPPQPQMAQAPQAPMQAASGGLAGMYTPEEDYAVGGIVAFAKPTEQNNYSLVTDEDAENDYQGNTITEGYSDSQGRDIENTDVGPQSVQDRATAAQQAYADFNPAGMTKEEIAQVRKDYLDFLTANAGPDIYGDEIKRGAQDEIDRGKRRNTGEAMALLTAAGKVLKGNTLAAGAGEALPAYAQQMNEVDRADQAERSANARMQFALKDAQRKERKGDIQGAQAATETARRFQQDANKAKADKLRFNADIATRNVQYARLAKGTGAGSGPKLAERLADAEETYALNPTPENKARLGALSSAASKMKTSFTTGEIGGLKADMAALPSQVSIDTKINESLQKFKTTDSAGSAYRAALRKKDTAEADRILGDEETRLRGVFQRSEAGTRAPAATSKPTTAPKPTATSKTVTMADIDATVAASGKTKQEVMDALKAKGFTVK